LLDTGQSVSDKPQRWS